MNQTLCSMSDIGYEFKMSITELGSRKLKTLTEPRQQTQRLPYLHSAVGQKTVNQREQKIIEIPKSNSQILHITAKGETAQMFVSKEFRVFCKYRNIGWI